MGDVGPCGPCSEIHYDRSDDKSGGPLVNADAQDTVVEIWNLVFIQFNRTPSGLKPLPAKHVDTGMGFERIVRVLQGKTSNYATDVFTPLIDAIADLTGKTYRDDLKDPVGIAFRAIADHARMATFSIADGAMPDNKGRGSVLRSVIRRAVRFGYQALDLREPFLHKLVEVVQREMGKAFPGVLHTNAAEVIEGEEADFLKTIERGLALFEEEARHATRHDREGVRSAQPTSSEDQRSPSATALPHGRASPWIFPGRAAFDLHTTFGFPVDLTAQLAEERGMTLDFDEYERLFKEFQITSGKGQRAGGSEAVDFGELPDTDDAGKYDCMNGEATVLAFVRGDDVATTGELAEGDEAEVVGLLLDRTCFYAEQGGQVGDTGTLRCDTCAFEVTDTRRVGNRVLHVGKVVAGTLKIGEVVECHVNNRRTAIMANHTATHLMNLALKAVLGEHVEQRGSLVDEAKTRFDFSHGKAMGPDEIAAVERRVNAMVRDNLEVRNKTVPLTDAKSLPGVRAVFGEKYPDPVRVVYVSPLELEPE